MATKAGFGIKPSHLAAIHETVSIPMNFRWNDPLAKTVFGRRFGSDTKRNKRTIWSKEVKSIRTL